MALALCMLAGGAHADDEKARQYKLEAAFLYNFFNYITWPGYSSPDELTSATICVLQGDPVTPFLSYVQEKMADQRQLVIRRLGADDEADGCQLFFSRRNMTPRTRNTVPILIVTADASSASNSMITMSAVDGRMALRIKNTVLSEQGFQASSRLLSLAQEVK